MVVVLLRGYVSKDNLYNNGFVHTRVKSYIKNGIKTKVFVLNQEVEFYSYSIDGVDVFVGNDKDFESFISKEESVTVCVHFLDSYIAMCLEAAKNISNVIVFVHGYEALYWYQRIFPYTFTNRNNLVSFLYYIRANMAELPKIRKFLRCTKLNCQFVTVSNWMKIQAEKAWKCEGLLRWNIIPNYVDSDLYVFNEKEKGFNNRFLSIRPFSSGKYANDITASFINRLNVNKSLNAVRFSWVGDGPLHRRITDKVKKDVDVKFVKRFLQQNEIVNFHRDNGIFVCPTRQDAQGVSMCEAMSSGLVPITLYNTAIPEFLPDDKELICHNVNDMVNLANNLINDYELFKRLSISCSKFISEKCSWGNTIKKEIELILNVSKYSI